ncbi:MAG: ATP-binding cassette domain-containing protein [Elusimicrobia bacterium]|nr:ATP-binding cassette domain-containing protein [Elusimicrobiota bacterium]
MEAPDKNHSSILTKVSFELNINEVTVFRGPAGSGKTKLMEILGLRRQISSGTLEYGGVDVRSFSDEDLSRTRQEIGFISEEPVFLRKYSLYRNLEFVLKLQQTPEKIIFDRIIHVLKMTGLIAKRDIEPAQLSRTERKLFMLSMELAREVQVLLCDFNFSGRKDEEEIMRLIKNLSEHGTGIAVTAREETEYGIQGIGYRDMYNGRLQ